MNGIGDWPGAELVQIRRRKPKVRKVAKSVVDALRLSAKDDEEDPIEELKKEAKAIGTKFRKELLKHGGNKEDARKLLGQFNAGYVPIWRQV